MSLLKKSPLCFLELTFDKKRLKILIMENLTKMKEIFNKLALVTMLAGSVLSFNGCKERIHGGNPTDPIVQPDKPAPTPELTNMKTVGNNNYKFVSFMGTGMIDEQVASTLNDAKIYMNVMLGDLNKSLEGNSAAQAYFADYINNLNSIKYERNNTTGIDPVINQLNRFHKTIFVEIVKNLNPQDRKDFIVCREALANDDYCYALSNEFNNNRESYDKRKDKILQLWDNWHMDGKPFEINYNENGLDDNSLYHITNHLDGIYERAAANIGHGVTKEHLNIFHNASHGIESTDAAHDFYGRALHNMSSCVPLASITDELIETARNLQTQEQSLQQTR